MMIATLIFNNICRSHCLRFRAVAALLAIGATMLLLVQPAAAVVLVNDTWKDGIDTDPAPPTYAENNGAVGNDADADGDLESAWFQGGNGILNPVGPNGPQRGDLVGTTASASWTTYFAPEATPVTLANEGDTLKITWVFTPTTVNASNTSQNFRIAILNSPEESRVTANASPGNGTYAGYAMFMNMGNTLGNGNPFQLRERMEPETASALLSASGSWSALANGAMTAQPGYTSGTQYTYTFEAKRNAANGLDIISRMAGEGLLGDADLAEVIFSDDTPNGDNFSFDTFQVRPSTGATTAEIFDMNLFKVEFITAAPPGLPGDYNNNGAVDAADYVLWRNNPASLENEGASPGVVDQADYTFWRTQFGKGTALAAAAAVPEPGALLMVALGLSGLAIARRSNGRV
jgi:hypothetical protein